MSRITEDTVAAAARQLVEGGEKPSVRKVTALLGGGSPNLVAPLLKAWKESQPRLKAAEIQLDPRITALIAEQVLEAARNAGAESDSRATVAEDDLEFCQAEAIELKQEIERLLGELQASQDQAQRQAALIMSVQGERDREQKEHAAAIKEVHEAAAREREEAEKSRQALARAELRLEAVPRLEAEIERLRGALEASEAARHQAEKSAAVSAESVERLNALVADLKAREQEARQLAQAAQAETEKALRDVNRAEKSEQACQARLETAARELEAAQKAAKPAQEKASQAGEDLAHARGQVEALTAREKQLTRELEQARKTKPGQAKES
jgi:chromosome segregation ATPase